MARLVKQISPRITALAIGVWAFALLSIGLTRDWQLRNEDNGAMHTTLALSHLRTGLAHTRAHDMFVDRFTGQTTPYGHHPPGPALLLAAAFALSGSDSPAVARLTVIAFHLGSIFLTAHLISMLLGRGPAIVGGFAMATVPMSTYFGRMVNYEPLCLFAVLLMLWGYARHGLGRRGGLMALASGVIVGGLIDWPAFFFAAALAAVELVRVWRDRTISRRALGVLLALTPAIFAFDIWHLWYAARGSLQSFADVVQSKGPGGPDFSVRRFVFGQLDTFRRYFTHAGFLSVALASFCFVVPRSRVGREFWLESHSITRYLLLASGIAALAYVVAAPRWASAHQYWQFYFLPAATISMVLAWRYIERRLAARFHHVEHVGHIESSLRGLRELRGGPGAGLIAVVRLVIVLELLASSFYWLHFRHTRLEAHAVETTASFRERLLIPRHLEAPGGTAR